MRNLGLREVNRPGPDRGSLGHVAMAQLHFRQQAIQEGRSPEGILSGADAMAMWLETAEHCLTAEDVSRVKSALTAYYRKFPDPPGRILGVECEIRAVVAQPVAGGAYSLQLADKENRPIDRAGQPLFGWAAVTTPGGKPVYMTRRLDLIYADRGGRVYILDHKFLAKGVTQFSLQTDYGTDGQFSAARLMGRLLYGDAFGGAIVQGIQTEAPWNVERAWLPDSKHLDAGFPWELVWKETQIEWLTANVDPWFWPKARDQQACRGRFGLCPGFGFCMRGAAALPQP